MKKLLAVTVLMLAVASVGQANPFNQIQDRGRPSGGHGGFGGFDRLPGGFDRDGNDVFVKVDRVCGITHVQVQVKGDNVRIEDLDVIFGNRRRQDIRVREKFQENSQSIWKNLQDVRGSETRCIIGFTIDAKSDRDRDIATVHLKGLQVTRAGDYREANLGHVRIKEYNRHRGPRGPQGPGRDFPRRPRR